MSEDFLLKWNDHHALFFVGAEELCESEEYTDVTLAAGTKFFSAHKLVLSICSPYFRQLFRRLGKDKSVVYLKDVDPRHLDLLLQYMYKGEIKVQENELVSVLNTAQGLEIKGLSENSTGSTPPSSNSLPKTENLFTSQAEKRSAPPPAPPPVTQHQHYEQSQRKRPKTFPSNDINKASNPSVIGPGTGQVPSTSHDPGPGPGSFMSQVKQEVTPVTIDLDDGEDTTELGDGGLAGFDGLGQELAFCDTSLATGYEGEMGYDEGEYFAGMEQHTTEADRMEEIQTVTELGVMVQWQCKVCGKIANSKSNLKKHSIVHTQEKRFQCKFCQMTFGYSSNKTRHQANCKYNSAK